MGIGSLVTKVAALLTRVVQPAQRIERGVHHGLGSLTAGDVARRIDHREALRPQALDVSQGGVVVRQAIERNRRAGPRHHLDGGQADAAATAGDEGLPVPKIGGKTHHPSPASVCSKTVFRRWLIDLLTSVAECTSGYKRLL
jgi:hypothetical protein